MNAHIRISLFCLIAIMSLAGIVQAAQVEDRLVVEIALTEQGFQPDVLIVPAGRRIKIEMTNKTTKVAELESFDMKFEKIASPGAKIFVFTGPLRAGEYSFFDDYSVNGVKGKLLAKDQVSGK